MERTRGAAAGPNAPGECRNQYKQDAARAVRPQLAGATNAARRPLPLFRGISTLLGVQDLSDHPSSSLAVTPRWSFLASILVAKLCNAICSKATPPSRLTKPPAGV